MNHHDPIFALPPLAGTTLRVLSSVTIPTVSVICGRESCDGGDLAAPSLQIWKLSTWKLLQESFSASFSFSANPTEKVFLPSKKCFYRRNLKTGWEISDNLRGHGGQLDADPYPLGPRIHWGAREGKSCGESFRMACLRNLDNHGFNCFGEMPKRCKTKSKM